MRPAHCDCLRNSLLLLVRLVVPSLMWTILWSVAILPRWATHNSRSRAPTLRSEEHTSDLQSQLTISYAVFCLFFNDTATTEIYTLSLHDALPIYVDHFMERSYLAALGDAQLKK